MLAFSFSMLKKIFKFLPALWALWLAKPAYAEQFVSLTLCSDRLLLAIARPEQIAGMSPYSNNPRMMLDQLNPNKPQLESQLTQLLPYLDRTFLLNETFYPELTENLRKLGAKIIPINDSPQTPEQLFAEIRQLGERTGNPERAEQLIAQLNLHFFAEQRPLASTLILSDTGVVETAQPQYQTLLNLLGLRPLDTPLTEQNFSLEKLLLSQPNVLIALTDQHSYNAQAEFLHHPVLQKLFQNRPLVSLPMKYTYCFDQGVWQAVERIQGQLQKYN